ncbi:MAG: hypothetical protein A3E78_12945 [Alphaproteobacteria bacterium RIFCSPHIGHO2_12_FULL_63_12]|nr:MAG: hypothetical protein A3E78_12945 [Alphaproteobacteria bacterium RIFCSPHIGHO2_12_FULL_63_12]
MKVLILGGYGFIGAEIMRACADAGFDCTGLGRSAATGRRLIPEVKWIGADIGKLDAPGKWAPHLAGVEAIVNAAGALQDGARDDLGAIHHRAIAALIVAAEKAGVRQFAQISAPGAEMSASTAFMRTKAAGDAAIRASSLDWTVLKPGLVIGRGAYGGTALLRMLAGFPLATPLVHASARVQTVALDDVAGAVVAVVKGEVPTRRDYDLVEEEAHTLREIVRGFRRQLGFSPARVELDIPVWAAAPVVALADVAGALGWRSPLRSTALKVMRENVLADASAWRGASGRSLKTFDETLAVMPGDAQDRIFARAQLALPLMVVALGVFWIISGAIGFVAIDAAAAHLSAHAGDGAARTLVIAGSLADLAIGAGLLVRRTSRAAAIASVIIAVLYLVAGTLIEPTLWLDPFGALAKIIPLTAMGLAVALLLEER